MSSAGRNDPCHCGSGKKYKKCCLQKDEALAAARAPDSAYGFDEDDLDAKSNGVLDLIAEGRLDEAEAQARDVLKRYPEVIDGLDRLARVYEARGDKATAAKYHRQAATFADTHDGFDPEVAIDHREHAERLERA